MLVRLQDCFVQQRFGFTGPRRATEQTILRRRIVKFLLPRKRFEKSSILYARFRPLGLDLDGMEKS